MNCSRRHDALNSLPLSPRHVTRLPRSSPLPLLVTGAPGVSLFTPRVTKALSHANANIPAHTCPILTPAPRYLTPLPAYTDTPPPRCPSPHSRSDLPRSPPGRTPTPPEAHSSRRPASAVPVHYREIRGLRRKGRGGGGTGGRSLRRGRAHAKVGEGRIRG